MQIESGQKSENNIARRNFIKRTWKILVWTTVAEMSFFVVSMFKSTQSASKAKSNSKIKILGSVEEFPKGSVTPFRIEKLFLSRQGDGGFLALSLTCSHLGCSVIWESDTEKFICPCHSSSFDKAGNVLSTPAPRALDYYPVIIEGGKVMVDTSRKIKRKKFYKNQLTYAS